MDKIVAPTQKKAYQLTNANISLVKAMIDKEQEAKETSPELEKVLVTLAKSETARAKPLQTLMEKEQWNLDNFSRELDNSRRELDTVYVELEKVNRKLNNVADSKVVDEPAEQQDTKEAKNAENVEDEDNNQESSNIG